MNYLLLTMSWKDAVSSVGILCWTLHSDAVNTLVATGSSDCDQDDLEENGAQESHMQLPCQCRFPKTPPQPQLQRQQQQQEEQNKNDNNNTNNNNNNIINNNNDGNNENNNTNSISNRNKKKYHDKLNNIKITHRHTHTYIFTDIQTLFVLVFPRFKEAGDLKKMDDNLEHILALKDRSLSLSLSRWLGRYLSQQADLILYS